jgi:Zn-dependent protease/predicted transcriptional regulator
MKNALKIGTFFGIPVSIHWTFVLILIFFGWRGLASGLSNEATLAFLGFILLLFVCVLLHEFGHALTARRFGIKTHSIVLLPIGGVASLEKMPENPKEELLVALAGPAVNIVIAAILWPFADVSLLFPESPEDFVLFKAEISYAISYLFFVNIMLVIFNMLPAFPMDGGRVLRAILSFSMQPHKATKVAATIGQVLAIGFILLGLFSTQVNPFIIIIGLFIFLGAKSESDFKQKEFYMKGYKVRDVMLNEFVSLQATDTLEKAVDILLKGQAKDFLVFNDGQYIGAMGRESLIQSVAEKGKEAKVLVATVPAQTLSPEDDLSKVFLDVQKEAARIWPVMENGKLIGALDYENISEFLMLKSALDKA